MQKLFMYNVWRDADASKTTVQAVDMNHAIDLFCANRGYADHADYCQELGLVASDINVEHAH